MARIEDLCHTHVTHKWLYHLEACAGSAFTPHDYITNVQKRLGNWANTGFGQCRPCGSFLNYQLGHGETCGTAAATRGHDACVHAVLGGQTLAEITTEPKGPTETQSRPADLFTTAAVPGRSAALDVCAASSKAAAARGDAAQAAFGRKTSHCIREIPNLRAQGIVYRHPNPPICSGRCSVPQRSANVTKTPPAQTETRNRNGAPPTESSHDTGSPP